MSINMPEMLHHNINIVSEMFKADNILNLFSDASMRKISSCNNAGCYGSVAVSGDTIIEEMYRCQSITTVPAAEIRGIRLSLTLALKYRYNYNIINIFSDSQIAILSLRDYIMNWRWNDAEARYYTGATKKEASNQELLIECFYLLQELRKTNVVNLFHQPGHVDNGFWSIKSAADKFKKANGVSGSVSYDFVRYISIYNNYVDTKSRSFIRSTNVIDNYYSDAIEFIPDGTNIY